MTKKSQLTSKLLASAQAGDVTAQCELACRLWKGDERWQNVCGTTSDSDDINEGGQS